MTTTLSPLAARDLLVEYATSGDCYQKPAGMLLTCRLFARGDRLDGRIAVHVEPSQIDFAAILDEGTWSSGEASVIRLAWSLWNDCWGADDDYTPWKPSDLYSLSADLQHLALVAITTRVGAR